MSRNKRKIILSLGIIGALLWSILFTHPYTAAAADDTAKPETPVLIEARSDGQGRITVRWQASSGAEKYRIYRQHSNILDRENDWISITEVPADTLSYTDSGLSDHMVYAYTVKAVNAAGDSGYDPLGVSAITAFRWISITNVRVDDVTPTGFSVHGHVTPATGAAHVDMHCWTAKDGRDDYTDEKHEVTDGRFSFRIRTADHRRESGEYVVHMYAWDSEGRKSECYSMWIRVPDGLPALANPYIEEITEQSFRVAMTYKAPAGFLYAEALSYSDADGGEAVLPLDVETEDDCIIRAEIPFTDGESPVHARIRLVDQNGDEDSYVFTADPKEAAGPKASVTVIDVGAGDAALIDSAGEFLLVDTGILENAAEEVMLVLKEHRVQDLKVLITHPHSDHMEGLKEIAKYFHVETLYMNRKLLSDYYFDNIILEELDRVIDKYELPVEPVPDIGGVIETGEAEAEIIGPVKAYPIGRDGASNNNSVWLKLHIGDFSMLFAGDAEKDAELDLLEAGADLSADVVTVNHHGHKSSSTEELVNAEQAGMAIVSCCSSEGAREEVLSRYRDAGAEVLTTSSCGGINVRFSGEKPTASFHREQAVHTGLNPVVHSIRTLNVTPDGYDVEVVFSAYAGIRRFETRTWTSADGQDDMVKQQHTPEGHIYRFYVDLSDHGFEEGKYNSYVIIEDEEGYGVTEGISLMLDDRIAEERVQGLAEAGGALYYVENGRIVRSFTGPYEDEEGRLFIVKKGKVFVEINRN